MPGRWETDWQRRRAAGIPGGLVRKTKPQLAIAQLKRLLDAGLPARWAAYDEVYGRSGELRRFCESRNLAYVAVIPRDFRVTLPSGVVARADQVARDAVFERRSCGNGSKGPRLADWALSATCSPRHVLLIRRLLSRPENLTFYLCWAPEGTPAPMTFFITIAGRRWPAPRSGSPSPKPPAPNAWPGSTPPGSSPARASPSTCAGPGGGAATRPEPGGTTTAPGCWLQRILDG